MIKFDNGTQYSMNLDKVLVRWFDFRLKPNLGKYTSG